MRLAASRNEEAGARGIGVRAHDGVHVLVFFIGEGLVACTQGEMLVGVHREGLGRLVVGEVLRRYRVAVHTPDGEAAQIEGAGAGSCCCRGLGDRRAGRGQGECRRGHGLGHGVGGSSGRRRLLWGRVRSAAVGLGGDVRPNVRSIGRLGRVGAIV